MPELRQNRLTKEWVIIATERAKRPEELKVARDRKPTPSYLPTCPFCYGNEHLAPPEVMRVSDGDGRWAVRVVPNKFSALARVGEPVRRVERSHRYINGVGIHDVIVENPDHSVTTATVPVEQVVRILSTYRERYLAVKNDPRIAHVTIFKNHGLQAGASLEHPHSQLIATPVVSSQVRQRLYEAMRHFDEFGECIFCTIMNEELVDKSRIVMATEHFVAMQVFSSPSPFGTHIYPRRHMAAFGDITGEEMADLAVVLRTLLGKLYVGLENPDYNYTIRTAPYDCAGVGYYHWYISVIPRLTRMAGFELGTGMFINTVLPEAAAEYLRNVQVEGLEVAAAS